MPKGRKRQRSRVPKESRKNLRLWAEGARETILIPHIDSYATALTLGWRQERKYWNGVCKEFHARVSWRTQDHEEPELGEWDPNTMLPSETLSSEEETQKRERVKELNKVSHRVVSHVTARSLPHDVAYPSLVHLSHPTASQTPHLSWLGPHQRPIRCPTRQTFWIVITTEGSTSISAVYA
jgi:hypothetical protein